MFLHINSFSKYQPILIHYYNRKYVPIHTFTYVLFYRKVMRAYQDSWDHRCRLLFCCMGGADRNRNSFTDIARLLSDFFRELDVVPSDVVAGLVLLRKFQKIEREAVVRQVNTFIDFK